MILSGCRALVVEDDYMLAVDAAYTLKANGAAIVGPYAREADALAALDTGRPTMAMLDINLGSEPCFGLARKLLQRQIPFLFTTGYDDDSIPKEFDAIKRLRKPLDFADLIRALAALKP